MPEILKAILLGIVQGLTEFLPVSSSGHLVFLQKLGIGEPSVFFNLMLHIGTLTASAIVLFKPLIHVIKSLDSIIKILISCLPTFVIALIFELFFEDLLKGALLGVGFLVTAAVLVLTETLRNKDTAEIDKKRAFFTGVMQGIAALPGISRSGMTIGFLKGTGVDGKEASEYSFIIGMPVILGGALFELLPFITGDEKFSVISDNWSVTAVIFGVIASFISGLFAIKIMLRIFSKKSLLPFAAYVAALAVISFIVL
ncbi:MAG: undecaprenyl-diphosphate phosphatase [Christensenellales bacterium]|jgi:undecaprenyl-diphosphatase